MLTETEFNILFGDKQHYIGIIHKTKHHGTLPVHNNYVYKRTGNYKKFNGKNKLYLEDYNSYKNVLRGQHLRNNKDDMYVHCYPETGITNYIVLDFDGPHGITTKAWIDINKAWKTLKRKNINSVRVFSGNKGYHLYIQIPWTNFLENDKIDSKTLFTKYWQTLINYEQKEDYSTLDENHWHNGLGANIRLIGSIHPRSGEEVRIINPNQDYFLTNTPNNEVYENAYDTAMEWAGRSHNETKKNERKRKKRNKQFLERTGINLDELDLREVFFDQFQGNFCKHYVKYDHYCCPFHDDCNPSLEVYDTYFICKGCGKQGGVYTLMKLLRGD